MPRRKGSCAEATPLVRDNIRSKPSKTKEKTRKTRSARGGALVGWNSQTTSDFAFCVKRLQHFTAPEERLILDALDSVAEPDDTVILQKLAEGTMTPSEATQFAKRIALPPDDVDGWHIVQARDKGSAVMLQLQLLSGNTAELTRAARSLLSSVVSPAADAHKRAILEKAKYPKSLAEVSALLAHMPLHVHVRNAARPLPAYELRTNSIVITEDELLHFAERPSFSLAAGVHARFNCMAALLSLTYRSALAPGTDVAALPRDVLLPPLAFRPSRETLLRALVHLSFRQAGMTQQLVVPNRLTSAVVVHALCTPLDAVGNGNDRAELIAITSRGGMPLLPSPTGGWNVVGRGGRMYLSLDAQEAPLASAIVWDSVQANADQVQSRMSARPAQSQVQKTPSVLKRYALEAMMATGSMAAAAMGRISLRPPSRATNSVKAPQRLHNSTARQALAPNGARAHMLLPTQNPPVLPPSAPLRRVQQLQNTRRVQPQNTADRLFDGVGRRVEVAAGRNQQSKNDDANDHRPAYIKKMLADMEAERQQFEQDQHRAREDYKRKIKQQEEQQALNNARERAEMEESTREWTARMTDQERAQMRMRRCFEMASDALDTVPSAHLPRAYVAYAQAALMWLPLPLKNTKNHDASLIARAMQNAEMWPEVTNESFWLYKNATECLGHVQALAEHLSAVSAGQPATPVQKLKARAAAVFNNKLLSILEPLWAGRWSTLIRRRMPTLEREYVGVRCSMDQRDFPGARDTMIALADEVLVPHVQKMTEHLTSKGVNEDALMEHLSARPVQVQLSHTNRAFFHPMGNEVAMGPDRFRHALQHELVHKWHDVLITLDANYARDYYAAWDQVSAYVGRGANSADPLLYLASANGMEMPATAYTTVIEDQNPVVLRDLPAVVKLVEWFAPPMIDMQDILDLPSWKQRIAEYAKVTEYATTWTVAGLMVELVGMLYIALWILSDEWDRMTIGAPKKPVTDGTRVIQVGHGSPNQELVIPVLTMGCGMIAMKHDKHGHLVMVGKEHLMLSVEESGTFIRDARKK